jgi:hypothetical protein
MADDRREVRLQEAFGRDLVPLLVQHHLEAMLFCRPLQSLQNRLAVFHSRLHPGIDRLPDRN